MIAPKLSSQPAHQPHRLSLLPLAVTTRRRPPRRSLCRHDSILASKAWSLQPTQGGSFTAEQLAWAQYPRYGTPAWRDRNVLRNRVEGANSLVKNTDIVRWGKQDSHHYRGRAFESIIAALAIAIVNLEQLENWEIVELDTNPNRGGRPRNPGLEQYLPATPTIATHAHSPP